MWEILKIFFLNTKKYLLKETQNAIFIKAPEIPWFSNPIGIWFSKRFGVIKANMKILFVLE